MSVKKDALITKGPHALARIESRNQALESFGINTNALEKVSKKTRALKTRKSKQERALVVPGNHDIITQ